MKNMQCVTISETFLPLRKKSVIPIKAVKSNSTISDVRTVSPVIEDLLERYLAENPDFRERTVKDYRDHLRYLKKWASEEGVPLLTMTDLTEEITREYRRFMVAEYAAHTVNVRVGTLKAFLRWAYAHGYVSDRIASVLEKVDVDEDDIRFFTNEQISALLRVPNTKSYLGFRNFCAMLVMLDNGIRIKELLSITWDDIDFSENEIRLSGKKTKTRKFRKVPISPDTISALRRLKKETLHHFPDAKYVFLSIYGKQLDPSTVRHFLREYGEMAGIEGQCSPHMFRHTFARLYVLQGADVFDLQEILGHSTLEMSRKYVKFFSTDITRNHAKYSPVKLILR